MRRRFPIEMKPWVKATSSRAPSSTCVLLPIHPASKLNIDDNIDPDSAALGPSASLGGLKINPYRAGCALAYERWACAIRFSSRSARPVPLTALAMRLASSTVTCAVTARMIASRWGKCL